MILLLQVMLSALASIYHQMLLKSHNGGSLHAANMMMYAAGTATNIVLYLVLSVFDSDEPGFFAGYGSMEAVSAIISNVLVGLAITAVYKRKRLSLIPTECLLSLTSDADAIIKCFATALSTGILLDIVPILNGTEANPIIFIGAILVFAASWFYIGLYIDLFESLNGENRLPGVGVVLLRKLSAHVRVGVVSFCSLSS